MFILVFPDCSCLILFFPDFFSVFLFVAPPHDCNSSGYVNETYNFSSNFPTLTSEVKTNMPHRILGKNMLARGVPYLKREPLVMLPTSSNDVLLLNNVKNYTE